MNAKKLFLIAFGSLVFGLLAARAGEFPDDWTWDNKPDQRAAHAALEGKPMPALQVSNWINGGITAPAIKGKVVVVDFYATWCGPCMAAIPHNNELLKKYSEKGLVIIGVCTSSNGQEIFASNAKAHSIEYPAARDPELKSEKAWAVHYYPTMRASSLSSRLWKMITSSTRFRNSGRKCFFNSPITLSSIV